LVGHIPGFSANGDSIQFILQSQTLQIILRGLYNLYMHTTALTFDLTSDQEDLKKKLSHPQTIDVM